MNDTQSPLQQQSDDQDEESKRLEEWRRKREEKKRRQRRGPEENGERSSDHQPQQLEEEDDSNIGEDAENRMAMMMEEEEKSHANKGDANEEEGGNDDGTVYLTAAKRRKLEQEAVLLESASGANKPTTAARRRMELLLLQQQQNQSSNGSQQLEANGSEATRKGTSAPAFVSGNDGEDGAPPGDSAAPASGNAATSLLEQAEELHRNMSAQDREDLARKEEENRLLREASKVQTNALMAAKEVASGLVYKDPMPSTWTAPKFILKQGEKIWNKVRTEWHILAEGTDIPPPMKRFVDMKFPRPILQALETKGIQRPTPIQMQGLPVALAGRDMVGIAFTGSGKTLTFALPLVMVALEEELRMPIVAREGPVGIILAPSRELARQTFDIVQEYCAAISGAPSPPDGQPYPNLTAQLMIGGESVRDQLQPLQARGVHCVVGTPGRVRDVLKRRAMTLSICRYICLDEADRMLDLGFDEEVGEIMNYFPHQRQTLLFSATFPKKFQDFARQCLVQPIVVNVGRAGAANLDVIQEVEYVKEEAKIVYLLHCLQKTAPPVIIFCERKGSADDIHEYLLLKGVEAVSIHGGKDQEERNEAIRLFKMGKKDVLIATDIAAKGLDFPDIQHVINFDMPPEIENYVHRIGRTGRCGKTGVATTFINKSCDETTLLDLKGLLKEARQRIPPVLMMLDDPRDKNGGAGCSFCGGLGHTIVDCPKIDKDARRVAGSHRDVISGGGDW
jgi:ATP-dependent RNA helicase DDX41